MPDTNPLAVHDVQVSQQTRFTAANEPTRITTVRFFVGAHGPFSKDFAEGQGTAAAVQAAISDQVKQLRELEAAFPGST